MTEHSLHFLYHITPETVVLTPNRRLAATLLKRYNQFQQEQQHTVWKTPDILPFTTWLQRLWQQSLLTLDKQPTLLSPVQEKFLWETVLNQTKEAEHLLRLAETADMVQSAYQLLKQWQLDVNHPLFAGAEDYLALQQWIKKFGELSLQKNCIDNAVLPDKLAKLIQTKQIELPREIILTGFTEVSPQMKIFLSACSHIGSHVHTHSIKTTSSSIKRISLTDEKEELMTMARWAKAIHHSEPQAKIACVIPRLDKIRDETWQIFSEVFAPTQTYLVNGAEAPFNISAGKSLIHYPVIQMAVQLLCLHRNLIPRKSFASILASPFVGNAETERLQRYHFDNLLRKYNLNQIDLSSLLNEESPILTLKNSCPQLARRLVEFFKEIDDQKRSYQEWAAYFTKLLQLLGWPGDRSLNSEEYQTIDAWMTTLAEFGALDHVATPVTIHTALSVLRKLLTAKTFQPESPEAPIQILGLLEAASLPFDYVWVAGMDDHSWPQTPNPNPLIPKKLQRELHMPHATAERELLFCSLLSKQFIESSPNVIFSHAMKHDDLLREISPLLSHIATIDNNTLSLAPYIKPATLIFNTQLLETMVDINGPICSKDNMIGGVDLLKQQALCPFKAFATHRLHAREMETLSPGLRAQDRGIVVHKILELLWNQINDHENLTLLSEEKLSSLLNDTIDNAMQHFYFAQRQQTHYLKLEKQRLHKLILSWMKLEKERDSFTVMLKEKKEIITLNQLTLSVRIDRVDVLANGKKLIIDYKTGKRNDIYSWLSDRPEEPQLPLYAMLDPDNTTGICFAQVNTSESGFKGISHQPLAIKGFRTLDEVQSLSWQEQLPLWRATLTKLSDDFYSGHAKIDPKDPDICTRCALTPFCRIKENMTVAYDNE